ncbi:MAG: hypothetical protein HRT36_06940 [Alphaproteobacteria bacterium]|nr:hypothetical protein [Alphaproteobacteria bacterium]
MINVAMGAALLATTSTILALLPLKEGRVALVKADTRENLVYRVEPITPNVQGFDLVLETTAKGFVENALTIERIGHEARGVEMRHFASAAYYTKFYQQFIKSGFLQDAMESGLIRSIVVESINHVDNPVKDGRHIVSIDYCQIDARDGVEIERKRLRAFLSMTTRPQQVSAAEMYENPLGVIVLDMASA